MSNFTQSENTQTIRGLTGRYAPEHERLARGGWVGNPINAWANGWLDLGGDWLDLGDTTGAPWEIYIKSTARDSQGLDWGTATYSEPVGIGFEPVEGEYTIDDVQAELLGNHINRLLKFYLQDKYIVNNIESVKLNILLKSDTSLAP